MQLGHHSVESSPRLSPTQTNCKRPSAADAHTVSRPQPFRQQSNTDPFPIHFPVYPAKVPRSASVKTPQEAMRAFGSSPKKHFSSVQGGRQSSHPGKNKKARQSGASSILALPRANDPVHDAEYINRVHGKAPLKEAWEQNPKSPLSNYLAKLGANSIKYLHDEILIYGNSGWRQVYCTPLPRSPH
jgi:hypothetical protein